MPEFKSPFFNISGSLKFLAMDLLQAKKTALKLRRFLYILKINFLDLVQV